ncbi:dTDP-4-dehydrorhamnose reductase [Palleronia marisminoris]|uniref:dTDP-4-dehydrorhamnose reductase n=1 Tax=Palleronia marisminoris TaxID=315423 RepID=A0A1Y5TV85_9RHOB|nr:dTDP-4-dehydrorhamnose reductase [Palleronia marisminoris]SFH49747.1 dTDP-4-dehydrorhamnose reductase [Palleronia marisminoris]SLN70511.1 dTDP-4-dehydrorhamnose reductase [Palleronia marisminoris]
MILVFGRTGQVARELADLAPAATFLGRSEVDVAHAGACAEAIRAHRPAAIINATAYTAVDRAEDEAALAHAVNGEAPAAMARAAAELGIPFVHISTDYVFDGGEDAPFAPGDPTGPLNTYGQSKLAGEEAVRAAGGPHAILRTSWVFSAHGANFVRTMLRLSQTRDTLDIVEDQVGGPTPASSVAEACLVIARRLDDAPELSGTYHLSGAPDTSWKGFAEAIFAAAGRKVAVTAIPTAEYPTPARRPLNSRLDCSTTAEAFGIGRPDWRRSLGEVTRVLTETD